MCLTYMITRCVGKTRVRGFRQIFVLVIMKFQKLVQTLMFSVGRDVIFDRCASGLLQIAGNWSRFPVL